jgi:hypothetical protein
MNDALNDYMHMLKRFIDGEMSPAAFQRDFLRMFKSEMRQLDPAVFEILDKLFRDVDSFQPDPVLFSELEQEYPGFYLDERGVREAVAGAYGQLRGLKRITDEGDSNSPNQDTPGPNG